VMSEDEWVSEHRVNEHKNEDEQVKS